MRLRATLALILTLALAACVAQEGVQAPAEIGSPEGWEAAPDNAPPPRPTRLGEPEEVEDQAAAEHSADEPAEAEPTADATEDAAEAGAEDAEAAPEEEPVPVVVKSQAQIACERKGGNYSSWGDTAMMMCYTTPRDAGKRCSKASDCIGGCLARSRTCAPITPIYGCKDVLNELGGLVTECLE
ncbi:hypothetical protein [Ostreiculturibacter nitratireducens]|uniref:hypothetical protein n=1 Tax=Ostreiculturibacter nitratireducens TaxID=3075226 RepID=UPI0031B5B6EE